VRDDRGLGGGVKQFYAQHGLDGNGTGPSAQGGNVRIAGSTIRNPQTSVLRTRYVATPFDRELRNGTGSGPARALLYILISNFQIGNCDL
jgi:hypothetical protein